MRLLNNFRDELRFIRNHTEWTNDEKFEAIDELHERYVAKKVKLFAIPDVSIAKRKVCPDCSDLGWIYDERTGLPSICPCHY